MSLELRLALGIKAKLESCLSEVQAGIQVVAVANNCLAFGRIGPWHSSRNITHAKNVLGSQSRQRMVRKMVPFLYR